MRLKAIMVVALLTVCSVATAEPYLAVSKGMQCSSCHSHPSGGGKRNVYGNVFAQTELSARRIGDPSAKLWTGEVFEWLSVGADLRASYESVDVPNTGSEADFEITRGTVYVEAYLIPNRLSIYVDQQIAPDSIENRELYLKLKSSDNKFHIAAGQFFLPYGLRLQDDSAFVRQASGVNFNTPDRGIQVGYESGPWSTQLSVTNGTNTGSVLESADQVSFVAHYVQPTWRAGVSFNSNNSAAGDRKMQNAFVGLKTNWLFRKGHNLKVSYEYLDPNDSISEDHQVRWSLLLEVTPMQFLQGRFGVRHYDGIPQSDLQNRDEFFVELHGFF